MIRAAEPAGPSLLVFSDDWGRHPSSCQHLTRRLLPDHPACWVNSIGTRTPRLDFATARRAAEKLRHWGRSAVRPADLPHNLRVVNPRMWPWFTRRHDRAINCRLLCRQLRPLVESLPPPVTAVSTLPITADLVGRLPVERWVYYCVDDFGTWPGLDGRTLRRMDDELVRSADVIVAASETLRDRIAGLGRASHLLTHGVDLPHWRREDPALADRLLAGCEPPIVLFWGVIDRRMDVAWVKALTDSLDRGTVVLVGPQADPDLGLLELPRVVVCPPVPYAALPALAARAAVLVMPYADLPVTRAMQPLKLKEYLATGRPVVVRDLPAVAEWSDALDAADDARTFAELVVRRIAEGTPPGQQAARGRLAGECWESKAAQFARWLFPAADRETDDGLYRRTTAEVSR